MDKVLLIEFNIPYCSKVFKLYLHYKCFYIMMCCSSRHTLQFADVAVDMTVPLHDVDPELADLSRSSSPVPPQQRSGTPTPTNSRSDTSSPYPSVQALSTESQTTRQKRRRSNDTNATEQQLLDILTQPTTTPSPYIPKDGDEMYYFALSLVPKLRRLLPRNQTRAQVHILTYLSELEAEENMQQSHTTTHPFTSSQQSHSYGFHQHHPTSPHHQSHTQQLHTNIFDKTTPSARSGQQQSSSMENPSSLIYHHLH